MRTVEKRGDLVLEKREKGTKNHGDPIVDDRGDLKTEGFAASCAFEDEDVAFSESRFDNGALIVAEGRVPEDVLQGEVWVEWNWRTYRWEKWFGGWKEWMEGQCD